MRELERIKTEIDLIAYAATCGYTEFDRHKSSQACVILRRSGDNGKIGVSRNSDGRWLCFDFRRDKGGSILDFVMREKRCNLGGARKELVERINGRLSFLSPTASYQRPPSSTNDQRRAVREYAATCEIKDRHVYLELRGIKTGIVTNHRFIGMVRTDRRNNLCFPYFNFSGIAGVERRNHNFKGYTKGGSKGLWHSKLRESDRKIMLFESPIDGLSHACLQPDNICHTRYFATGGQISKHQWPLIDGMIKKATRTKMQIVLAFDNDQGGRKYIQEFQRRFPKAPFELDLPPVQGRDWNDELNVKLCT
jgi:hypothetical protein